MNQTSFSNQNNNLHQDLNHNYLHPNIINNFLISNTTPICDLITKYQVDWEKNDLHHFEQPSLKDQIKEIKEKNSLNYDDFEIENKYLKICQQNLVPLRNYRREDKIKPEKEVKSCDRDPELFLQSLIRDQELIQSQRVCSLTSSNVDKFKVTSKNESVYNNKNNIFHSETSILSKNFSSKINRFNSLNELEKEFNCQVIAKPLIPVKISSSSPKSFYFIIDTKKSHSLTEFKTVISKHLEKKKLFYDLRLDCSDFVLHLENNIVLDQNTFNFEELIKKYITQIFRSAENYVLNINLIFTIKFFDKFMLKNNAFSEIFKEDEIESLDNDENNPQKMNHIIDEDSFGITLTKKYQTKPDYETLNRMEKHQLENVKSFEISNEFGRIKLLDPVDLSYINLDNIHIEKGQIFIDKIEGEMKKLNKRADLELYGINDTGEMDTDQGFTDFVKKLSERCKEIGVKIYVI